MGTAPGPHPTAGAPPDAHVATRSSGMEPESILTQDPHGYSLGLLDDKAPPPASVRALYLPSPFLCNGGKSRLCVPDRHYAGDMHRR